MPFWGIQSAALFVSDDWAQPNQTKYLKKIVEMMTFYNILNGERLAQYL